MMAQMRSILRLEKPAKTWDLGFPIGNGRLGAMPYGRVEDEIIVINEETMWYGPPHERTGKDGKAYLPQVRKLLLEGKVEEAQYLARMAMTSSPKYLTPYQPAGELRLSFFRHGGTVTAYSRELDIDNAVTAVSYQMDGVPYRREMFASLAANVVVLHITCGKKGGLTFNANLNRRPFEEYTGCPDGITSAVWGRCGDGGVAYFGGARVVAKGGNIGVIGDFLSVQGADEATVYITLATDFSGGDCRKKCMETLDKAVSAGREALWKQHLKDYHKLYDRVSLSLEGAETTEKPVSQLLEDLRGGAENPALAVLLFNYGRYLLICSSYQCLLPATLQGIWNGSYTPPWESKYTININTEMNYWPAEVCGLPECHMPLFDLVERMVPRGQKTAKELYGCEGFVAHHNTNIWADTDPEGILSSSPIWPMGAAWLSLHFYEHYLFTRDNEFLTQRAIPVMREAVRFFTGYLTDDGKGNLLTGPSISPENTYLSSIGEKGSLCMAPTMDLQILRQLLKGYLAACKESGQEDSLCRECEEILPRLPATRAGSDGRIMEWYQEYGEVEPGHRHISHLYGLYPGNEITEAEKGLFDAADKTLDKRLSSGGGHTGWSRAWIINFYARLKNGEKAHFHLMELLKKSILDNLLDTHPPFQIDGNFGAAAAVAEMLIQSHNPYIEVLPALPPRWESGSLNGVRLRGGYTADIQWENNCLKALSLTAAADGTAVIRYGEKFQTVTLKGGEKTAVTFS